MIKELGKIRGNSRIPKYKQLVDTIITEIEVGIIKTGDRIPSINETSEEYYLSRATAVKAYDLLRRKNIITAVKGKGFYVTDVGISNTKRILLLFNKLSDHKKTIYNSFVRNMPENTVIDLQVHHSDASVLEKILTENVDRYDHYIIMPHLKEETKAVKEVINNIPKNKLILVNKDLDGIEGEYACVYEDFEMDIYHGLYSGLHKIRKFHKLYLVFPTKNYYCSGIKKGFVRFCGSEEFQWEIINTLKQEIAPGELYIVIEESDLVDIIKQTRQKNLELGWDIGVISYNNSPFKEILAGGISVLSTDFDKMGSTIAEMVLNQTTAKVKNDFSFSIRDSI